MKASVTLWLWPDVDHVSNQQVEEYLLGFSTSEKLYLSSISARRRRLEYIAGHHLIRQMLAELVPHWDQDHSIEHHKGAAPFLSGSDLDGISFNLSHSGNRVCCVVGLHCELGLDIELPRERRRGQQIAETYFTENEAERIARLPLTEQSGEFYRVWTLKESLLKARRESITSKNIAIEFQPQTEAPASASWYCYSFMLDHLYGALSLSSPLSRSLQVQVYRPAMNSVTIIKPETSLYTPQF
ncbi:MAG: 4'-phosphopantetheinyl transferase superfamily protein [Porticoccaceae bacterium]|nr:4'-phosphopantetheinyl transferase superfamily protein [Porticoccaceae bacterium]